MAESIIKQTNCTLLIEEINPEKLNLLTLVGDVRGLGSLNDDKIKEINEALEDDYDALNSEGNSYVSSWW